METKISIINHSDILELKISPLRCLQWVEESFRRKYESQIPPKISLHPREWDFFNTMPCLLPNDIDRFSVKVVNRIEGEIPSLKSQILLYECSTGNLLAVLESSWITTMRTGAVAALSSRLFEKSDASVYGFIGLGNTARATALCLLSEKDSKTVTFKLLKYKDQAESFIERFSEYSNINFEIVDSAEEVVATSDVVFSSITSANDLLCPNDAYFKPGVLIVPIHTRGFQNCDLFFDKIYADDEGHVKGFKYFSKFLNFNELSRVLLGEAKGRENDEERILSYNIGLGMHDGWFATHIYDMIGKQAPTFTMEKIENKFWI